MWRDLSVIAVVCGFAASLLLGFFVGMAAGLLGASSPVTGAGGLAMLLFGTIASAVGGGYVAALLRPGAEIPNAVATAVLGLAVGLALFDPGRRAELALHIAALAALYVGSAALGGYLRRKVAAA